MTFGFTKDGGKLVSEQRTGDLSYNFKGSSLLQEEWGAKMKAMSPEILNGLMSLRINNLDTFLCMYTTQFQESNKMN